MRAGEEGDLEAEWFPELRQDWGALHSHGQSGALAEHMAFVQESSPDSDASVGVQS